MITATAASPIATRPIARALDLLKQELAPYSGRGALVVRMAIASTAVMLITLAFRLPLGSHGAIYSLILTRESPRSTLRAAVTVFMVFAAAAAFVLIGGAASSGDPTLRFLWVVAALFAMFFVLSTVTDYAAATGFGLLIALTIPIWDLHISPELKVERTLWVFGQTVIACAVTILIELAFARWKASNDTYPAVAERLETAAAFLMGVADGRVDSGVEQRLTRFGMVGTSRLRESYLRRATYSSSESEKMGALVALAGRVVDVAVNLAPVGINPSSDDRERLRRVADDIERIRADLLREQSPRRLESGGTPVPSRAVPLLPVLEQAVSLIPDVFTDVGAIVNHAPLVSGEPSTTLVRPDALSNPEHLRFALKGCLASSVCYMFYTAANWPGISTAVVTCLLTALTTIGASRQKQILRVSGAVAGGIVAIGAQVLVLPYLDSIGGFTVLFVVVTVVAAWIATSSSRVSYFGIQAALAFYVVHLAEFAMQTSLAVARDRVVGILVGLFAMWLVFDQLWGTPAPQAMKRELVSTLRRLAELAREPASADTRVAIERSHALREMISQGFDRIRALSDSTLLEFGPDRASHLAWRLRVLEWQPPLRVVFLTRVTLFKYRLGLPGFELPDDVAAAQAAFDKELGIRLDAMADRLSGPEMKIPPVGDALEQALAHLEQVSGSRCQGSAPGVLARLNACLSLSRQIETLVMSLDRDVVSGLRELHPGTS
jgi:multidrug resistance protein MdtO